MNKYRLLIVTGTIHSTASKMNKELSIENKFEEVISADILKYSKPYPEPYQKAIEALQLEKHKILV